MRKLILASAAAVMLAGVAACGESAADKQAEVASDKMDDAAAMAPTAAQGDAMRAEGDRMEQQAGNADGGMTTGNTPSTATDGSMMAPAPAEKH